MSFLQRELDRIRKGLLEPRGDEEYRQLHAAQQALSWALEPTGFKSPYDTIMGTPEGLEDCPSSLSRDPS